MVRRRDRRTSGNDSELTRGTTATPQRRTRSASPNQQKRKTWTEPEETYAVNTRVKAERFRGLHYRTAMYYHKLDTFISLPAYILQLLTAGSALSALQQEDSIRSVWLAGITTVLSVSTLVLKAIADYKKFAEQEHNHKKASEGFSELIREIKRELFKVHEERQYSGDFLLAVDEKYARLKGNAGTIPQHIIEAQAREAAADNGAFHRRDSVELPSRVERTKRDGPGTDSDLSPRPTHARLHVTQSAGASPRVPGDAKGQRTLTPMSAGVGDENGVPTLVLESVGKTVQINRAWPEPRAYTDDKVGSSISLNAELGRVLQQQRHMLDTDTSGSDTARTNTSRAVADADHVAVHVTPPLQTALN